MDDQLDDDLKNRIREVFDNYEDTSADQGWLELRKKFPEEESKRRAFAWMWWGAAALLLLSLSIGLWVYTGNTPTPKMAAKPNRQLSPLDEAGSKQKADTVDQTAPAKTGKQVNATANNNIAVLTRPAHKAGNNVLMQLKPVDNTPQNQDYHKPKPDQKPLLPGNTLNDNLIANTKTDTAKAIIKGAPKDQEAIANKAIIANTPAKTIDSMVVKQKPSAKSINAMFAEDNNQKNNKKDDSKSKEETKKVRFAVYAATYFNYAKGSSNQLNAGGGFTSDIRISRNLKLVTGVNIGQNSLNYTDSPPAVAQATFAAAATVAAAKPGTSSLYNAASPTFKNYNASLVGLDIPVNLKYEFNPQKSETYFSLGLSSGTFINESYTYQYNNPALFTSSEQTKGETTTKSFDNFYFAKTLNVAFGLGYPLGRNRIIFEPFLKYPLDGLGAQQLRFGEGGLNLKFNFGTSKK